MLCPRLLLLPKRGGVVQLLFVVLQLIDSYVSLSPAIAVDAVVVFVVVLVVVVVVLVIVVVVVVVVVVSMQSLCTFDIVPAYISLDI